MIPHSGISKSIRLYAFWKVTDSFWNGRIHLAFGEPIKKGYAYCHWLNSGGYRYRRPLRVCWTPMKPCPLKAMHEETSWSTSDSRSCKLSYRGDVPPI